MYPPYVGFNYLHNYNIYNDTCHHKHYYSCFFLIIPQLFWVFSCCSDLNTTIFQLGQLKINQIKLEQQEKTLKEQLSNLEQLEKDIAKELTDKYGKGSLDIETGNFSPLE